MLDEPINLGSQRGGDDQQLVDVVEEIAGIEVKRRYNLDAPKSVRGSDRDNAVIIERLRRESSTSPRTVTEEPPYRWIYNQVAVMRLESTTKGPRAASASRVDPGADRDVGRRPWTFS